MLPLASVMAAREQMGPNRMAVLLDSDRAGLDKAKKLVEMMAHGQDSVMLLGEGLQTSQGAVCERHRSVSNSLQLITKPLRREALERLIITAYGTRCCLGARRAGH